MGQDSRRSRGSGEEEIGDGKQRAEFVSGWRIKAIPRLALARPVTKWTTQLERIMTMFGMLKREPTVGQALKQFEREYLVAKRIHTLQIHTFP